MVIHVQKIIAMKKVYFNTPQRLTQLIGEMEIVEISSNLSLLAGSANLGSGTLPDADFDDVIPGSGLDASAPSMLNDLLGLPTLPDM